MKKNLLLFSRELDFFANIYNNFSLKVKKKINISAIFTSSENITLQKFNFLAKNIKEYPNENNIAKTVKPNNKIKISKYIKIFKYFIYMLDFYGTNRNIFSKKEKLSIFKIYINKTIDLLNEYSPNVIVFTHTPHELFDIVLIKVCELHKIKTVFPRGISIAGYYILQNKINIKTHVKISEDKLILIKRKIIDNKFTLNKNNIFLNYYLIKSKITERNNLFLKLFYILFLKTKYLYNILKIFIKITINFSNKIKLHNIIFSPDNIKYKNNQKLIANPLTNFQLEKIHYLENKKKFNLLKVYNSKCCIKKIDLQNKYIYFPLWFQPSSTLYPYADNFLNYLYSINLIRKNMPDNISLYIKESPDIFNISHHAWFRGSFVRNFEFYNKIYKMKNVFLVNFDIKDEDLIKKSMAVVTLCDKNFIKSYISKKPTISLGNTLVKKQNGFFPCRNEQDIQKALKAIQKKITIKTFQVNKFLDQLFLNSFYKDSFSNKNKFTKLVNYNSKVNYKHISRLFSFMIK